MARKAFITDLILKELPNSIERGWGSLIQWTGRGIFAENVSYEFPFLQNECGPFEIQVLLASMHFLTIFRSLDCRIEDVVTQSPSADMLIVSYSVVADLHFEGPISEQPPGPVPTVSMSVRTRLQFDESGEIESWVEDWSQTQREFCKRVMDESEEYSRGVRENVLDDFVMEEEDRSFAKFTDNRYLDADPGAKAELEEQLPRLLDFLSYKLPKLGLLGIGEASEKELEEQYDFFADDVEMQTPNGYLYGRTAVELIFPFSRFVAKLFFKTISMEIQSVQQPGKRIVSCTYLTRAISRVGGAVSFTTRSVFYVDKRGKIAKQMDTYSLNPFSIMGRISSEVGGLRYNSFFYHASCGQLL